MRRRGEEEGEKEKRRRRRRTKSVGLPKLIICNLGAAVAASRMLCFARRHRKGKYYRTASKAPQRPE